MLAVFRRRFLAIRDGCKPWQGLIPSNGRPVWTDASKHWTKLCEYMGVSKNSGTPKSSILIGISIINHPFWGTPIFGNTHMVAPPPQKKNTMFRTKTVILGASGGIYNIKHGFILIDAYVFIFMLDPSYQLNHAAQTCHFFHQMPSMRTHMPNQDQLFFQWSCAKDAAMNLVRANSFPKNS